MEVRIDESWKELVGEEFEKEYFRDLVAFVKKEYSSSQVFPPGALIFNAFNCCPVSNLRAVIIGQDPYHGPGQAHGLCFSVRDGIAFPPSLVNIFKEISGDLGYPPPLSGNLERWASQGVLLLNSVLTVRAHKPGSHQNMGWEKFTDAVIKRVNESDNRVVFMLWGAYALRKGAAIDRSRHLVLESVHPSPLSAHRGFFGNHHFSRCNEFLESNGISPIDWH
jgi:uracil-DNA glycosylase